MILRSIDSTDRGRFGGLGAYRSRWRRPARALCFLFLVLVVGCSAPAPEPTREALPEPSEVLVREGGEEQQATEVVLGEEEAVAVEVEGPPVAPPGEVGALEEPSETVGQERQAALRLRSGRPEQGTPPKRLRPSREGGLTLPVPSTVEGSKAANVICTDRIGVT